MSQDKLFSDEEVIEKNWNNKYPCPKCEVGKLVYSETESMVFISCFKCHFTWRREVDQKGKSYSYWLWFRSVGMDDTNF